MAAPEYIYDMRYVQLVFEIWSSPAQISGINERTVEDPALRGSEGNGYAVAWFLNGIMEWWSAGVVARPGATCRGTLGSVIY